VFVHNSLNGNSCSSTRYELNDMNQCQQNYCKLHRKDNTHIDCNNTEPTTIDMNDRQKSLRLSFETFCFRIKGITNQMTCLCTVSMYMAVLPRIRPLFSLSLFVILGSCVLPSPVSPLNSAVFTTSLVHVSRSIPIKMGLEDL
jgi:hypothetical protein